MAKPKQCELAVDRLDTPFPIYQANSIMSTLGFGRFELLKDYFHANPIWKNNSHVSKIKTCYDLVSLLPWFPRAQRSKGRLRSKKGTTSVDGSIVEDSQNECYFDTHPRKRRSMRRKREEEPSDYEVISKNSSHYGTRSIRQHRRTTDIQKKGMLDSRKFEFYLENMWRSVTEDRKNVFTYLDSLWFSLYSKGPLKEKVLSWIKKKDIFSTNYVFVPIVQWGHWFLLILCNFGKSPQSETKSRCMLLLDPLRAANSKQLEPGIRRFVFDIFRTEEQPVKESSVNKIPLVIPQVPQQQSDNECGFYVLYYINLCLERRPDNFSFSMGYPHFMKEDWFTPQEVECFVKRLDSMNRSSD